MITFHFIFRPSVRANQLGSISLRITYRQRYRQISLPVKAYPSEWDEANEITINPTTNEQLVNYKQIAERIAQQTLSRARETSNGYLLEDIALQFRSQLTNDLADFTETIALGYQHRKQERTARAYLSAVRRLIAFNEGKPLKLIELTPTLIEKFERALQNDELAPNTISFYMRNLRTIYNKAVKMKKISRLEDSPFENVFTGIEKTRKRALDKDEINSLNSLDLKDDDKLDFARKLFFSDSTLAE